MQNSGRCRLAKGEIRIRPGGGGAYLGVSRAARCLDCLSHSGYDIFIHVPCGYRYVNASYGGTTPFSGHLSRSRVSPLAFLRDEIRRRRRSRTWPAHLVNPAPATAPFPGFFFVLRSYFGTWVPRGISRVRVMVVHFRNRD